MKNKEDRFNYFGYSSDMRDEEGNPVVETMIGCEEDELVLATAVKVMNTAEGVSGEDYLRFKNIIDRVHNEIDLNSKEIYTYHDDNSTGLKGPISMFSGDNNEKLLSSYYRKYDIENWYHIFYEWDKEEDKLVAKAYDDDTKHIDAIKQFLADKQNKDKNWARALGQSLYLLEDYWGNYPAFAGKLKPADFARVLADVIRNVGKFLRKVEITPNLPLRITDFGYDIKAEDIHDDAVSKFLREYIGYYKENDTDHLNMQVAKLYINRVKAKEEASEKGDE